MRRGGARPAHVAYAAPIIDATTYTTAASSAAVKVFFIKAHDRIPPCTGAVHVVVDVDVVYFTIIAATASKRGRRSTCSIKGTLLATTISDAHAVTPSSFHTSRCSRCAFAHPTSVIR